jgi:hypothetical protein
LRHDLGLRGGWVDLLEASLGLGHGVLALLERREFVAEEQVRLQV